MTVTPPPPPPSGPPAGWYDDPNAPGQQRYWDGLRWTEHIHSPERPYSPPPSPYAQPQATPPVAPATRIGVPAKSSRPWWQPLAFILAALVLLVLIAAVASGLEGGEGSKPNGKSGEETAADPASPGYGKTVTNKNWEDVYDKNGAGWEGASVRLVAQAYDREGDLLLAWGDYENVELPAQVTGSTEGVSNNDYVLIEGTLTGSESYETVLGANQETLAIDASSVREITQEEAEKLANPTTDSVKYHDSELTQHGFTVEIKSISWTDEFTRVAVEARNKGKDTVSLTAYDAVLKQGSKQYEQPSEQQPEDSELDSDIRPGVTKKETLTFGRINKQHGKAELAFEWYSDDIDVLNPKPFKFRLGWR